MTDRFVALPVGQGDAFFLQRGTFTALIDGGRSTQKFPELFCKSLRRRSIDVLVCTHNDADHANGILGFLESGLSCGEVWLPALWQDRLHDLLTEPGVFRDEVIRNVRELPQKHDESDEQVRLDRVGDRFANDHREANNEENNTKAGDQPSQPASLQMENHDDGNKVPTGFDGLRHHELFYSYMLRNIEFNCDHRRWRLLGQALSAANRIRNIAISCARRGVPIRWFKYSPDCAKGGRIGLLTPLNSVEIPCGSSGRISAFEWIALTTANRRSLTFCLPPKNNQPGAVFTADSDLKFSAPIPWQSGMIVTAPHHGSEENKYAYERLHREIENEKFNVIWVRSDGNFIQRPGPAYLCERCRFCTLCRSTSHLKQAVKFTVKNGRWAPITSRQCVCK